MEVIAIDPGERIGVARWEGQADESTNLVFNETLMGFDALCQWLDRLANIDVAVIEDYRLRQGKQMQQTGSKFEASQVIGAMRLWCHFTHTPIVMQRPEAFSIAAMHQGFPIPKGHMPDKDSARLHGQYYLEQVGLLRPVKRDW